MPPHRWRQDEIKSPAGLGMAGSGVPGPRTATAWLPSTSRVPRFTHPVTIHSSSSCILAPGTELKLTSAQQKEDATLTCCSRRGHHKSQLLALCGTDSKPRPFLSSIIILARKGRARRWPPGSVESSLWRDRRQPASTSRGALEIAKGDASGWDPHCQRLSSRPSSAGKGNHVNQAGQMSQRDCPKGFLSLYLSF